MQNQYMKEIINKTFKRKQTTQNYSKLTFKKIIKCKKKKKKLTKTKSIGSIPTKTSRFSKSRRNTTEPNGKLL